MPEIKYNQLMSATTMNAATNRFQILSIIVSVILSQPGCAMVEWVRTGKWPGEDELPRVVVQASVTSYSDEEFQKDLKPHLEKRLLFVKNPTDNIVIRSQNQKIVNACQSAAVQLGYEITYDPKACQSCLAVYFDQKSDLELVRGDQETHCATYYSPQLKIGTSNCSTWIPTYIKNNRWIAMEFYPSGTKRSVHRIVAYSSGENTNVVSVAEEMCYAALKTFPAQVEDYFIEVSRHLADESKKKPASDAVQPTGDSIHE